MLYYLFLIIMSHINICYDKFTCTTDTIGFNSFDLSIGNKELLKDAKLSMCPGQIYGLIGSNGSGKSSLLKKLIEMKNDIKTDNMQVTTLYVEQEIELDSRLPVDFILDSNYKQIAAEKELNNINSILESEQAELLENDEYECLQQKARELTHIVTIWDSGQEKINITKILGGLGFCKNDLTKPSYQFSGGWQMRISLARALYLEPDLLLLDEPTNHLDLEAIIWLADYLNNWSHTVIVVSHNIGFLNEICDFILNIDNKKIIQYKGNYNSFKICRDIKTRENEKEWEKYDKKLKELKKKGTDKNKIIEFTKTNFISRPAKTLIGSIDFGTPIKLKSNMVSLTNVNFSYGDNLILSNVSLGIDMNSKIVLMGPNGSGKSTLIKLITNEIQPSNGSIYNNPHCKIGYYNQHFENLLPADQTPVQYLKTIIPPNLIHGNIDQTIRSYLGQIRLDSIDHTKLIGDLSGGQKARVAIVKLIFMQPHCLILDEPTNHLDIDTVDALIHGLINFKGGILTITHEPELIKSIEQLENSTIWVMDPTTKNISKTINSYDQYCSFISDLSIASTN